ncbi:MAG: nucleotidyltransferase domain-containing protein [Candidatus Marinimicrobia bacterium]|nr:nucleotidyltransferase domain-containing protein [Candidatus Neomarinimicrobiota bacterium]
MSSNLLTMKHSFTQYPLQKILAAPSHISILRVLNQLNQGINGRETARRAGINDRTCRLSLLRLEQLNLIENLGSGKTKLFRLNRNHYFNKHALSALFTLENEYLPMLKRILKKDLHGKCVWACIYGSVAKKTDTEESDLDVCIVANDENSVNQLENLIMKWNQNIYMKFGLSFSPVILTLDQWQNSKEYRDLINDVIRNHIPLAGTKPR